MNSNEVCGCYLVRFSSVWGTHRTMYFLHFKIKVTFGHKLRYKIKITCGENSLKLRQTHWNVVRNNVNVVVDELTSQMIVYTCLILILGLNNVDAHQRGFMHFGAICPNWHVSNEIGAKTFQLYFGHP